MEVSEQVNPFTHEYLEQELEFYGLTEPYEFGELKLAFFKPGLRCDDFLNVNVHLEEPLVPILVVNGVAWMSLTWREVQSHVLPIRKAEGDVGIIGSGLGYYTLAAMKKEEVNTVTVFEIDPHIMWFFQRHFNDRPGYEKVRFVVGDALKTCRNYDFDLLYNDRYATGLPDETLTDIHHFQQYNRIYHYHPWSLELCYLLCWYDRSVDPIYFPGDIVICLLNGCVLRIQTSDHRFMIQNLHFK